MTSAPETLKAVRRLLLAHLDIHENSRAYPTDLDPEEVGIVGDPAHRGGYHCGRDRVDDDDYSVRESSRDRLGLTDAACALDVGQWSARVGGKSHDLRSMSLWLVAQCKAGAPDTRDIREVIYSPDGSTVRRWDRLGRRSTGDSSHRWHTHISYHRDAIKAGRDQSALWRRYLTSIGLMEDEMPSTDEIRDAVWKAGAKEYVDQDGSGTRETRTVLDIIYSTHAAAVAAANPTRLAAELAPLLPGGSVTDEQLERVLRKVFANFGAGG